MKLFVITAILLFLISACGRNTDLPQDNNDENAPPPPRLHNTEDDELAVHTASIGGIHAPVDMGGRILRIGTLQEDVLSLLLSTSTRGEPDPATSTNYTRDRMIWDNARRVEREFNFSVVEDIPTGPARLAHQLRTSVAAGDAFADIVLASPDLILEAAVNHLIQPLDLIDLPESDLLGLQIYSHFTAEGLGHGWAFCSTTPNEPAFTLGVNLDLILAEGAPNPVDLYNSGQWTWNAMLDIMRQVTRDTTGDGVTDQWGLIGVPTVLLWNLVGANDGMFATDDLTPGIGHQNTIQALEFLETIQQEELIRRNYRWTRDDTGFGYWPQVWSMAEANAAFVSGAHWDAAIINRQAVFPFEFAILPLPVGPSNTSGNTGMSGWNRGLVLPHNSPWEGAELLMIMEEYFSWAGYEIERINDIPTPWFNGIYLDGVNAIRQRDATRAVRQDLALMIPNIGFGGIAHSLSPPPFPDHPNWQNHTPHEIAEIYYDTIQEALERFFR